MYLHLQESEFQEFLEQSAAFWREHTGFPADTEARIYVDLAHDNPAYLLTNLWIAKYLQRFKHARLIGLAGNWPKATPHYSFDAVKRLADSFLLDEVIDLDSLCCDGDGLLDERFAAEVKGLSGTDLRRVILGFAADVDPDIGWVLYDTWLRQERIGTIETANADLLECASVVFRARSRTMWAMREGRCVGAVVGHYHYSPYAWMAREAVRHGGFAYFQSLLLPVSIRRFADEADFRRGRAADFLEIYESQVSNAVSAEALDSFARRMFDIQSGVRQFFRVIPHASQIQTRQVALCALELDPKRPVVCFFVPALCGPPHCFGPLPFDDNGDWLKRSLDLAASMPQVNFLVKGHPQDAVYDVTGLVRRCEEAYGGYPNIRFLPSDASLNQIAELCDVAVTISGTPGYEMAARGVATIAAGPSRYSQLGFSRDVKDIEDYAALLRDPLGVQMDEARQRKAILFLFFEMTLGRSQASFIPALGQVGTASFWKEATRSLRAILPEEDPLYRNMRHMVSNDLPFLLNTDVLPPTFAPPPAPVTGEKLLAGLHAVSLAALRAAEAQIAHERTRLEAARVHGDMAWKLTESLIDEGHPIRVGIGCAGTHFLAMGWSVPEPGGLWTDGDVACISFPSNAGEADLCIECHAYVTGDEPWQSISAWQNHRMVAEATLGAETQLLRIPVRSREGRVEITLQIATPRMPDGGSRRLGIWASRFWLERRT